MGSKELPGPVSKEVTRETGEIIFKLLESPSDKAVRLLGEAELLEDKKAQMLNRLGYYTLQFHEAHGHPFDTGFLKCTVNGRLLELGLKGVLSINPLNNALSEASFIIETRRQEKKEEEVCEIFKFTTKPEESTGVRNGFSELSGEMSAGEFDAARELITLIGQARKKQTANINFVWLH